ncbi:hypothetical protein [Pinibacter aurantiacus]|uniref:Uncharacterized protein n=1 Tax=Pinibacter aurantiacus TaxID=2851599 RepID=A0A9E2S2W5_9BACT|nr:hypothetical protein [Pinibacter aurantiacus]MBV4355613.1 hypothetical protein [Pinibacter aurantiacus]
MAARKKAAKKATKKAAKPKKAAPKKAAPALRGASKCVCDMAVDGTYWCFKKVQGSWIGCSGPYETLEECKATTGEICEG